MDLSDVTEFRVPGWANFQHYRNRKPSWIKLHWDLLTSRDWVCLDSKSRELLIVCMLVASRSPKRGYFDNDPEYIKRVGFLRHEPDFKPLIKCGFLQVASANVESASNSLSIRGYTREIERGDCKGGKQLASRGRTSAPKSFPLTEHMKKWASGFCNGLDLRLETDRFLDYHRAKGTQFLSWESAWRNWVRKAVEFRGEQEEITWK